MQHGEVGVDVVEEGGDQRLEAGCGVGAGRAAGGGRRVVGIRGGAGRGERVRVTVAVHGLRVGGVPAKQHELAEGVAADQRAQLHVEGEGARGANVLHLALLVGQKRQQVLALAVAAALLLAVVDGGRVGQRDAQRAAQLAHLVHVGHVGLRQQALDQRLEQRQAVAEALDAAIEALLARLRREALDVVHDAVAARVLAGLFSAFLLARLALVAARLGALPLVERHSARRAGARCRRRCGCGSGRHGRRHRCSERMQALARLGHVWAAWAEGVRTRAVAWRASTRRNIGVDRRTRSSLIANVNGCPEQTQGLETFPTASATG